MEEKSLDMSSKQGRDVASPEQKQELCRRLDGLAEGEEDNLKMEAFLKGRTAYEKPGSGGDAGQAEEEDESGPAVRLPLLDRRSQTALRRKVVMDQLDKV